MRNIKSKLMLKIINTIVVILIVFSCSSIKPCRKNSYESKEKIDLIDKNKANIKGKYCLVSSMINQEIAYGKGKIKGYVFDRITGGRLKANIEIVDQKMGCAADDNGFFELLLNDGEYSLNISHVGYNDIVIKKIKVLSQREINLVFYLGTTIIK